MKVPMIALKANRRLGVAAGDTFHIGRREARLLTQLRIAEQAPVDPDPVPLEPRSAGHRAAGVIVGSNVEALEPAAGAAADAPDTAVELMTTEDLAPTPAAPAAPPEPVAAAEPEAPAPSRRRRPSPPPAPEEEPAKTSPAKSPRYRNRRLKTQD